MHILRRSKTASSLHVSARGPPALRARDLPRRTPSLNGGRMKSLHRIIPIMAISLATLAATITLGTGGAGARSYVPPPCGTLSQSQVACTGPTSGTPPACQYNEANSNFSFECTGISYYYKYLAYMQIALPGSPSQ